MKILLPTCLLVGAVALTALAGCHHRETVVVREDRGYVEEPVYVVVPEGPPPVIVEHRPQRPSRDHIWVDGYWHWDSHRYAWQKGHWAVPPRKSTVWVSPRYERHEREGYRYVPGRWSDERREQAPQRAREDEGRREDGGRREDEGGREKH